MNEQPVPRVHIAPEGHPWAPAMADAARRAGADVDAAGDASVVMWLTNTFEPELTDALHEGVVWVQLRTAGVESWLDQAAADRGRQWTSARGIYAEAVAEHALASILAGLKLLPTYARATSWDADAKGKGQLLRDATVAVIGAGGIGQELIRYLQPFGSRIIAVTRTGRAIEGAHESLAADRVAEVFPRADVVVLSAPSTPGTSSLVGASELEAMREQALLVNIARGSLIDTEALVACLQRGGIGGAMLDVTDPEPLPDDHPLWREPRALITPHAANPGPSQMPRLAALFEDNLRRFTAGEPLRGLLDFDAGY